LLKAWLEDREFPSKHLVEYLWESWKKDEFKLRIFIFFYFLWVDLMAGNYSYTNVIFEEGQFFKTLVYRFQPLYILLQSLLI